MTSGAVHQRTKGMVRIVLRHLHSLRKNPVNPFDKTSVKFRRCHVELDDPPKKIKRLKKD